VRRGLLFAGTERAVYVSFDDGDHWQSLRLNMPATSMRDLWIQEADLVVGTHGRSAWVLDDITPLRQAAEALASDGAYLFRPARATRVRWNLNTDTPLPIDEPTAQNPPDGAVLDYWLAAPASGTLTLEIMDRTGALVRRYASDDPPEPVDSTANFPLWWIRRSSSLGTSAGAHRFVWDLRYPPPPAESHSYPIAAILGDTPREPRGPFVPPGTYFVRLTANGRAMTQPIEVRMDPRVRTPAAALQRQHTLAMRVVDAMRADSAALAAVRARRAQVGEGAGADSLAALEREFARLSGQLAGLLDVVSEVDAAPTSQALRAADDLERALTAARQRFDMLAR
jgi:hypothetical protein